MNVTNAGLNVQAITADQSFFFAARHKKEWFSLPLQGPRHWRQWSHRDGVSSVTVCGKTRLFPWRHCPEVSLYKVCSIFPSLQVSHACGCVTVCAVCLTFLQAYRQYLMKSR